MVVDPPPYEPYLNGPPDTFKWRLGLRPLDLDDWLQFDADADRDLEYKAELLATHPDTVFVALPDDDVRAASAEVLAAIGAEVRRLGRDATTDADLHPLDAAGRLVQEDLVLLVERDGELVCGGGSVCFPNRWHLPAKVGRSMSEIHQPVARLNDELGRAIDRTLGRLRVEQPYWRLGWTVLDTDELYQAVDGSAPSRPTGLDAADHWLRVERETLRRFPDTGCVLFTIRTYRSPILNVPTSSAARLAGALEAMPDDIVDYKSLQSIGPAVATWLRGSGGRTRSMVGG